MRVTVAGVGAGGLLLLLLFAGCSGSERRTPASNARLPPGEVEETATPAVREALPPPPWREPLEESAAAPAPRPFGLPATGERISLDLSRTDIHDVLRLFSEVGGIDVLVTDGVAGRLTLRLADLPWDEALGMVLEVARLEGRRRGNVLFVSTREGYREEHRERLEAEALDEEAQPREVAFLRVNYARAATLAQILSGRGAAVSTAAPPGGEAAGTSALTGLLGRRGVVAVDELTNTLVVHATPMAIERARRLVREIDVPIPQVLIETSIVEATTDFARELGVEWGFRHPGSGLGGGIESAADGVPRIVDFPATQALPGAGSAARLLLGSAGEGRAFEARLSAFERAGKARIVSRPRVVTLNNVPATIKSLTIVRVRLPGNGAVIQTGTGGTARGQSAATEKIETGIILVVTPQVSTDGTVLLDLSAKSSQADFTRTVDEIPTEITREANSHVLVRSGETVVLGGIYREEESRTQTGLPLLRELPGLGWLFRNLRRSERREDLLVFLTPTVLDRAFTLPAAGELWYGDASIGNGPRGGVADTTGLPARGKGRVGEAGTNGREDRGGRAGG